MEKETNKTAEITKEFIDFCKEHNIPEKHAGYLTGLHVKFSTQQSKEKDERIEALEFANEEVRKKHDLACGVIAEQDEEIKRLREALTELVADLKADGYNHRLGTMDKVNKALNQ